MKGYHVGDFIYAKLLIINCTNSYIGQAFTEGCLKKIKIKNCLDKRALWAKGQVLKHPPPPPPPPPSAHVPVICLQQQLQGQAAYENTERG